MDVQSGRSAQRAPHSTRSALLNTQLETAIMLHSLAIITLLGISFPCSAEHRAQNSAFDPSGYFIPNETQKNFTAVRWILLSDYYDSEKKGPVRVELRIGDEKRWMTFRQASLRINGTQISFKTKARKERSYEFQGQFLPSDREKELGHFNDASLSKSAALRGTMKTIRRGKVVRVEEMSFLYTAGN
jgi:hypothetical protein